MKKKFLLIISTLLCVFLISSCSIFPGENSPQKVGSNSSGVLDLSLPVGGGADSSFAIQFIDVGQGDSALIECDGHYMLIDGGLVKAGNKVYQVLKDNDVQELDILAISHMHRDHYGGLKKALTYPSKIGLAISNSKGVSEKCFNDVNHLLLNKKSKIKVPKEGTVYNLGSAKVEVVSSQKSKIDDDNDDSLVLLITYGKNKFLFTGDIEYDGETYLSDKYENDKDKPYKIDVVKMPHHGAQCSGTIRFLRTFKPVYAIISAGNNNRYHHPHEDTLSALKQSKTKYYRTDIDHDIFVESDGKKVKVYTLEEYRKSKNHSIKVNSRGVCGAYSFVVKEGCYFLTGKKAIIIL